MKPPEFLMVYSDVAHEVRDLIHGLKRRNYGVYYEDVPVTFLERVLEHICKLEDERNERG